MRATHKAFLHTCRLEIEPPNRWEAVVQGVSELQVSAVARPCGHGRPHPASGHHTETSSLHPELAREARLLQTEADMCVSVLSSPGPTLHV